MIIGILAIGFFGKYLYGLAKDIHAMSIKVDKLDASIGHEKGNPIEHYTLLMKLAEELRELRMDSEEHVAHARTHYDDIKRLNDQDVYARCNIDKCPHLVTVISNIRDVVSKFNEFDVKASESRNATGSNLEEIRNQMQILASEVSQQSKQMVSVLTDLLVGRSK